jgi:hypothetical protein
MNEENHIQNILKIVNSDYYDSDIVSYVLMYVATRGLDENYYSDAETYDMEELRSEINKFLESIEIENRGEVEKPK